MSEIIGSLYEDICNLRSMVSVRYHPVRSAELLKSALERTGRLKVLSREVPSVSALCDSSKYGRLHYDCLEGGLSKQSRFGLLAPPFFVLILFIPKCLNILFIVLFLVPCAMPSRY